MLAGCAVRERLAPVNISLLHPVVLGVAAAVFYALAGALLGLRLARAERNTGPSKAWPLLVMAVAVVVHALLLRHTVFVPGGVNLGFFHALSVTGWIMALLLLVMATLGPLENLGILLLPFCAVTVLLGLFFPIRHIVPAERWPLELHIVISIVAYGLLALAAVQALLLALQDHRLRHRNPGGFLHGVPPLMTMETLLFQMIGVGFGLLTLALLSGFLFIEDIFAQHMVQKTTLSIAAWLIFGTLLWGRWRYGWRGRIAVRWTLVGFGVLMLAYFGTKLVLEIILRR